jgi:hypothetical protein
MKRLKPQEVRCLLLKAEGYTYKEICELTGWTYTKVNRCLTEGRRAFVERLAGIEGGSECERLRPLVSLLADGELRADELRALRPHLKSCLACRALLAEYRAAPGRVAALLPPAALLGTQGGALRGALESLMGAGHAAAEAATGQKVAAVAASAAALAGGGATVGQLRGPDGLPPRDQPLRAQPVADHGQDRVRDQPPPAAPAKPAPPTPAPVTQTTPAPAAPPPQAAPPPPPPDPAAEFSPGAGAPAPGAQPRTAAGFGATGGDSAGGGGGEFSP